MGRVKVNKMECIETVNAIEDKQLSRTRRICRDGEALMERKFEAGTQVCDKVMYMQAHA
jgi:hypothetical protein